MKNEHPYLPYDKTRISLVSPYIANPNYQATTDFLECFEKDFYIYSPRNFKFDAFVKDLESSKTIFEPISLIFDQKENEVYIKLHWPNSSQINHLPKAIRIFEYGANETPEQPVNHEYIFSFSEEDEILHIRSNRFDITIGRLPRYLYMIE